MTKKGKYHISCDPNVWNMAKVKIAEPLSCFIEKQLVIACRLDNQKAQIEKELHEKEQEVIALRSQLCKLQKEDTLKRIEGRYFDDCMIPINRIHDKAGVIGENQIEQIALQNDVNPSDLIRHCESLDLNIVKMFEFSREGKLRR